MKRVRAEWKRISKRKGIEYGLLGFAALIVLVSLLHAQTTIFGDLGGTIPVQSQNDTIVNAVADEMGLAQVSPADLPRGGTYWWVLPGGATAMIILTSVAGGLPATVRMDTTII